MKNFPFIISTLVITLFFSISLNAQVTTKSSFLLGGSLSFNTSNSNVEIEQDGVTSQVDKPETSTFTFEPVFAYFLLPNFAIGGQVSYTSEKIKDETGTDKTDNLLLGPIVRYYIPFMEDNAAVFVELDAAFGSSSETIFDTSTENTISKFGIGPGLTVFVNDLIGLEAIAKYNYVRGKADVNSPTIDYSSISTANEFDFQIGLQFYFTRK